MSAPFIGSQIMGSQAMGAATEPARPRESGPRESGPRESGPGLTPVGSVARQHPPRAPFVVTVLLLLLGGLGGLLLLNTLLAQGSFTVHDLDVRVAALKDQEQALQQKVATLAAPARLAHRASALGMVPAPNPAFIRMSDGQILGEPKVAAPQYTAPPVPPPVPAQNDRQQTQSSPTQQTNEQTNEQLQQQSNDTDGAGRDTNN